MRGIATIKRRVRSLGGYVLRRLSILPGGVPNRLGDDAHLKTAEIEGDGVVFFPDTPGALYQIRQWYGPLAELHRERGVTIVCMDSRTAGKIRDESRIPVITISQESFFDELMARSNVKLFLYVNYSSPNMLALRYRSAIHVSMLHGDSDKGVSVSNQAKAFDFSFVAGQAAIDRYSQHTTLFNAAERCVPIGRPSMDTNVGRRNEGHNRPPGRVVLYAPTWEGGHESVNYSSLVSHGEVLVESLTAAGCQVIFRPHPLTGQRLAAHGEALEQVKGTLRRSTVHSLSLGRPMDVDFAAADILITDISSVANDWLATGKPFLVTVPTNGLAREAKTPLLGVVPRLSVDNVRDAGVLVEREIVDDPHGVERRALIEYYLGDITPGAALARFLDACRFLCELRDREWGRIQAGETDELAAG